MDRKTIVMNYWMAFNNHNVDAILSILADDVTFYGPSNPQGIKGKNLLKLFWETVFYKAIPDMKEEIKNVFIDGDTVSSEAIESGTLTGELIYPGEILPIKIAPTNKSYRMRVSSFFKVNEQGSISEIRAYWDLSSFLVQTGIDFKLLDYALKKISDEQKNL